MTKNNIKIAIVALSSILISQLSFAQGKAFRTYWSESVEPEVKKAVASLKSNCGCTVKIDYDKSSIKSEDNLRAAIANPISKIPDETKDYCTDKASKDAMCKMKSLVFKIGKENKIEFNSKNGEISYISDGTGSPSFSSITAELDK